LLWVGMPSCCRATAFLHGFCQLASPSPESIYGHTVLLHALDGAHSVNGGSRSLYSFRHDVLVRNSLESAVLKISNTACARKV
jgi:hypothetical protein